MLEVLVCLLFSTPACLLGTVALVTLLTLIKLFNLLIFLLSYCFWPKWRH